LINVVCDLDGVLYRGESVIPGADVGLRMLEDVGIGVTFVTNNSTNTPSDITAKIERVVGVSVGPESVITSAQAATEMLSPDDWPVYVFGETGIKVALTAAGVEVTEDAAIAGTIISGLHRGLSYEAIGATAAAVSSGARFIATNVDPTFPTATGFMPGAGAMVAAIAAVAGVQPEVAGKPNQPMLSLVERRVGPSAWVIGDRIDTDMAMSEAMPGWTSILVLTGVTSGAEAEGAADHLVQDFLAAAELVIAAEFGQ
jgi:HAD superfamily hydrolase (TIGR01450 family)